MLKGLLIEGRFYLLCTAKNIFPHTTVNILSKHFIKYLHFAV